MLYLYCARQSSRGRQRWAQTVTLYMAAVVMRWLVNHQGSVRSTVYKVTTYNFNWTVKLNKYYSRPTNHGVSMHKDEDNYCLGMRPVNSPQWNLSSAQNWSCYSNCMGSPPYAQTVSLISSSAHRNQIEDPNGVESSESTMLSCMTQC